MQVEIEKDMDQKYSQPENTSKKIALLSVKGISSELGVFQIFPIGGTSTGLPQRGEASSANANGKVVTLLNDDFEVNRFIRVARIFSLRLFH